MDAKKLGGLTLEEKRAIIIKEDASGLSVRQQCELLEGRPGISRVLRRVACGRCGQSGEYSIRWVGAEGFAWR